MIRGAIHDVRGNLCLHLSHFPLYKILFLYIRFIYVWLWCYIILIKRYTRIHIIYRMCWPNAQNIRLWGWCFPCCFPFRLDVAGLLLAPSDRYLAMQHCLHKRGAECCWPIRPAVVYIWRWKPYPFHSASDFLYIILAIDAALTARS